MSNEILTVQRSVLTPALLQDAAKEASILWDTVDEWQDMTGFATKIMSADEFDTSFLSIDVSSKNKVELFSAEAPAITNVLHEMHQIPTQIEHKRVKSVPILGLVINYCPVGRRIAPHRDKITPRQNTISRIATLCGIGKFGIIAVGNDQPVDPIQVNPGDLHEMLNEHKMNKRPLHWADTIGNKDRISIAFQIPVESVYE